MTALGAVRATAGSDLLQSCASPTSLGAWFPCSQETSWHKVVAGAPAITSNIPGRQAGKGWRTNPTPALPHVPLVLSVSSSPRPTLRFANLPELAPAPKAENPSSGCTELARVCCCGRKTRGLTPNRGCSRLCPELSVPPGENRGGRPSLCKEREGFTPLPELPGKPASSEPAAVGPLQLALVSYPVVLPEGLTRLLSAQ